MKVRFSALVALAASAWATGAAADTVLFDGKAHAPYQLMVGDAENWGIPVGDYETDTLKGYLNVKTDPDTGVRVAEWNGKGEAQLFLASPEPIDMSAAVAADAALMMVISVQKPPRKGAVLRMGCGYPCAANADITQLLKALPKDELLRVSVDLKCFVDGGLDATHVEAPFLIITDKKMTMSVADVRIVDGAGPSAFINCR